MAWTGIFTFFSIAEGDSLSCLQKVNLLLVAHQESAKVTEMKYNRDTVKGYLCVLFMIHVECVYRMT
jgi:hypothetical protein